MAGFRLLVWYGNGPGVLPTPEDQPQEWLGVRWNQLEQRLRPLLDSMEESEGGGVRKITVEVR